MVTLEEVSAIVGEVLQVEDRAAGFTPATPLLGAMPEFDSMAVVSVISALEDHYGITIEDDEITAETFDNMGNLLDFVRRKVDG